MGMETLPTVSSSKQGKGYVLCEMIMIQDISCDARQVANILLDANSKNKGISLNYPCQFERDLDAQVLQEKDLFTNGKKNVQLDKDMTPADKPKQQK
ncbi:hypothetical protein BWQ96_06213 [Gracilariopsis chorda]|uniref:Uncharacterized protein n=1 Tax=Gracilariopsis chorda TaxID=448386 RepID=A0A2V3ISF9_9FLOR|nr:hypothetical protein BWQ96_06213 [Gracilariopsis chorda]|eukprot:PXF44040.1 hypothetical protein BWQ96_06213 [Gracilariopsis chorda]